MFARGWTSSTLLSRAQVKKEEKQKQQQALRAFDKKHLSEAKCQCAQSNKPEQMDLSLSTRTKNKSSKTLDKMKSMSDPQSHKKR